MIIPGEKGFNVKDLMGNHYLFCHSFDAGIEVFPTHLTNIQDPFYARPFLMHLCELGSLGGALRDLYLYARPDTYQLHKKNDWEVLAQLIQMLETEELRVWLIRDILKEHAAALLAKSSSAESGAATSNAPAKPVVGSSPPKRSKPPADPLESSESSAKASVYEPETSNGEVSGEEPNMATKQVDDAANRKLSGDNLNSKVEHEADTLISAGRTDGVAISCAGIPEFDIVGESFQNIPFSMKKGRTFPGTERFGENNGFIRVTDQNAYLDEVTRLYAKTGNDLNPVMREQIKAHVKQGAEFGLRDDKGLKGIPGLHAEVQSANYVLNQVKASPGFDIGRVQVSTYKLQNSPGQGAPFTACNHCSGILQGFDILTGH